MAVRPAWAVYRPAHVHMLLLGFVTMMIYGVAYHVVPRFAGFPLHGLTLEAILNALVAHYGWPGLGERIPVRCFTSEPSIASSLKFLRKTPWAREKVEGLYLFMLREQRRGQ